MSGTLGGQGVGPNPGTGAGGVALVPTLLERLAAAGLTVVVAESLTGGAISAELSAPAGASRVFLGGVVVYATELKRTLVGVDAGLLGRFGPVHPDVASQLASGVRRALAVDGRPADIGLAVTGVAGPDTQSGMPVGRVYGALASERGVVVSELNFAGDRASIRQQTVDWAILALHEFSL